MLDRFPSHWQFLEMTESHIPDVRKVELRSYPYPWSEGIFKDCVNSEYLCRVLYDVEENVVAYAIVSVAVEECHILNICVSDRMRGQGVARVLLRRMLQEAQKLGAVEAFLEVRPTNQAAISLYKSFGFVEIGRRKNYYPCENGREDAIAMAFDLVTNL
ncbi:MAG: ribosomal protein S18-alanine N-acetyltransferase [Pseudomonadales bacterium]|nr:ribosomal protein S18-alanine N-acetyltransferase [Pseudomonadales bacterium]